jgi:3-deoxy-D-manno-octulosonic acid (KDO) 8-phosphate synthase
MTRRVEVTSDVHIGDGLPFALMAGPCVIEELELCRTICREVQQITRELGIPYIFKASFDKANRTSVQSFRGDGMQAGLDVLAAIKAEFGVPVVTDVHQADQCAAVGEVVDAIGTQIPNPPPVCDHGHILKQGISKGGKPYYGYVCKGNVKEDAVWAKMSPNGRWYFGDE